MRGGMAALVWAGSVVFAVPAIAAPPGAPELKECPKLKPLEEPLSERRKPLAVPRAFAMIVTGGVEQVAVATVYGGTVCIDARGMDRIDTFTISTDRRFVEFDWTGYEADGHIVVDRTGKGQVVETGVSPTSSPSRQRFAAVQQSEAAFGGLEGFGVWQMLVVGLRRLTLQQDIPSLADWRIDGWKGDDCIDLSGVTHEAFAAASKRKKPPRQRFIATLMGDRWTLRPAPGGCPLPKKAP